MEIRVDAVNSSDWRKLAFDSTVRFNTNVGDLEAYMMEHSPIRVEIYCVRMIQVPVFASTHFVRHGIGCDHFILTQRDDRGGVDEGRWTPTNHTIFMNAQALINVARERLCLKSHSETVKIMSLLKKEIGEINPALEQFLVPNCVYRGGLCKEGRNTCGKRDRILSKYSYYRELFDEQYRDY